MNYQYCKRQLTLQRKFKNLVLAMYHFRKGSSGKVISYEDNDISINLSDSPDITTVQIGFDEDQDHLAIEVRPISSEYTSTSIVHNAFRNRNRIYFQRNAERMIRFKYLSGEEYKPTQFALVHGLTEEELFQLSTMQNVPETDFVMELYELYSSFDFIPDDTFFRLAYSDSHLFDDEFIENLTSTVWKLINA